MAKKKDVRSRGKYNNIIIPVILLLILILSTLSVILLFTRQISELNSSGSFATNQANIVQKIKNSVYNINIYAQQIQNNNENSKELLKLKDDISQSVVEIRGLSTNLSAAINAFKNSEEVNFGEYHNLKLMPLSTPRLKNDIDKATEYWGPYQRLLQTFSSTFDSGEVNLESIQFATEYAKTFSDLLYFEFVDISNTFNELSKEKTKIMNQIILVGLIIAITLFIYIIFVALRQLIKSDHEATEARRETTEILDTVQEGLFLVDQNLNIGSQQSKALSNILPGMELAHRPLQEVLHTILSEKDINDTRSYINQIFKAKIKEKLIRSLNPLNKIQVFFDNGKGVLKERYLKFDFNRVYENDEIKRVLVSVSDISQSVELEKRLKAEREENSRQIELLIKVLRIEPTILRSFMRRAQEVTDNINHILQRSNNNTSSLRRKIEDIFREIHGFKGESSALEFDQFVTLSQEMEAKLRNMRENPATLTGDDFLTIAVSLDAIIEQLKMLDGLQDRLQHYQGDLTVDVEDSIREVSNTNSNQVISKYFIQFAEQAAKRNNKLVDVVVDGFDLASFDDDVIDTLKSIIVQLIRNAIVHGIETPEKRKALHKTQHGNIGIHLLDRDDCYDLIIEDDGAGINTETLKAKLRENPDFTRDPDSMTHTEILRTIFLTGLSTADTVSEDAGQGVGMDVVRDHIRSLGAKIGISSKEDEFTRFVIRIPKQQ